MKISLWPPSRRRKAIRVPLLEGRLLEGPNWLLWRDSLIYRHWATERGRVRYVMIDAYDLRTAKEKRLLTFDPADRLFGYGIAVSPDGRWLLYSKAEPRNSDILVLENFR